MTIAGAAVDGIIDSIDLPILVVTRDSTLSGFNQAAAQLLELGPADVGRRIGEISLLSKVKRLEDLCADAIVRGVSSSGELRDPSGSWFVLSITPCRNGDPSIPGAVLTLTNVTAFRASLEQAVYERQYTKDIVNTVSDALVVVDDDLQIQTANQAFHAMFGVSRENAQDLRLTDLGDAHWAARLRESVTRGHSTGNQADGVEVDREFPAVGRRIVVLQARPLSRQGNRVQTTLLSIHDITVRKQAEEAFRRRTAQFETLLDRAPVGVYLVDGDFRIRQVNPMALPVFGDIPALIGRDFGEVIHILWPKRFADEIVERFRHTLETGEPHVEPEAIEERLDRGVTEFYEWRIDRIQLPEGSYGVVCYFRDISVQVRARREIGELLDTARSARQEAERANQAKDRFLAVLSHELRTPVAALLLQIALLRRQVADGVGIEQTINALERIAKIKARLNDDLLDVSRIISGRLALEAQPVSIPAVVREAVELVKGIAAEKSITLEVRLNETVGLVLGDAARLRQAVCNLLTNSVKFTPEAGRVSIEVEPDDGDVRIQVIDTGVGFEASALPHLFDPFSQSEGKKAYGGLGLGLTIVRHVVEGHQGTVEATSEGTNRGASFTITLPVTEIVDAEELQAVGAGSGTLARDSFDDSQGLEGIRVLVVEDDAATREALVELLGGTGAEVTGVSNAADAIRVLQEFRPALLISDIGMPDADGYSLIRQIRSLAPPQGGQVAAVAFTALASEADRDRAILAGFDEHVAKPVKFDRLVGVLVSLSRKGSARQREEAGPRPREASVS